MAVTANTPVESSPKTPMGSKTKRVRVVPKPWSSCPKASLKEWVKEDYLNEFQLTDSDWEVFDALVILLWLK